MAGWLIRVKTADRAGERSNVWVVASQDWMVACNVARQAQAIEAGPSGQTAIIDTRALRQATVTEVSGLANGEARRRLN